MLSLCLTFWELAKLFSLAAALYLMSSPAMHPRAPISTFSLVCHCLFSFFFFFYPSQWVWGAFHWGSDLHFPDAKRCGAPLHVLPEPFGRLLWRNVYSPHWPMSQVDSFSFLLSYKNSLHMDTSPFSCVWFTSIFYGSSCHFLDGVLQSTNVFNLMLSTLSIAFYHLCLSQNPMPDPGSWRVNVCVVIPEVTAFVLTFGLWAV